MATRIGINGFGRIGRYLVRLLADDPDIEIAVINARARNIPLAHLLKYDSVHHRFPYPVCRVDGGMMINEKFVPVTRRPIGEWQWKDYGVDIVIETTGTIKDLIGLSKHIDCGAEKVLVSYPLPGADAMIVMGVNHHEYDPSLHQVVSAASCTTNCLAPPAMIIHETFGIKRALMTTIHSYTMSQRLLDGSHKDLRRSRAAALNMIPTTTGAAIATALVYPALKGRIDGMAVRVPTPNVSLVDLTCELEKSASVESVNAALKQAAEGRLNPYMGYSDEPLVSVDYIGTIHGGVVDSLATMVQSDSLLKLILWYDNEAGFTNQLVRLLRLMVKGQGD